MKPCPICGSPAREAALDDRHRYWDWPVCRVFDISGMAEKLIEIKRADGESMEALSRFLGQQIGDRPRVAEHNLDLWMACAAAASGE